MIRRGIYNLSVLFASLLIVPIFCFLSLIGRFLKKSKMTRENIKIIWGTTSLTNYKHWSNALVKAGWNSESVVAQLSHHSTIKDFDKVLLLSQSKNRSNRMNRIVMEIGNFLKFFSFFCSVLLKTNLVMHSCEGLIFQQYGRGFFRYNIEFYLLKISQTKIGVIPYGGDAQVYRDIRNPHWLAGLLVDYPENARKQNDIDKRVQFYVEKADIFLPGSALLDGFGRSDRISPNTLCIDTHLWSPKSRMQKNGLIITHAPNHRKVKGTSHVIEAVNQLIEEGHELELLLIEGKSNEQVRVILQEFSDIHIDQLNSDAYALSAIESMSLAIPTISSFSGAPRDFFDTWSFTEDCPIVDANAKNLKSVLRNLIIDEDLRRKISENSREYVINYHSEEYFAKFFYDLLIALKIIRK